MKLYIAGPVSDIDGYNFPAFRDAAEQLTAAGYEAVNPTRHGVINGYGWADYMRMTLAELLGCNGVAVLDWWEYSRGARLEVNIARTLDMPVRTVAEWLADAEAVAS